MDPLGRGASKSADVFLDWCSFRQSRWVHHLIFSYSFCLTKNNNIADLVAIWDSLSVNNVSVGPGFLPISWDRHYTLFHADHCVQQAMLIKPSSFHELPPLCTTILHNKISYMKKDKFPTHLFDITFYSTQFLLSALDCMNDETVHTISHFWGRDSETKKRFLLCAIGFGKHQITSCDRFWVGRCRLVWLWGKHMLALFVQLFFEYGAYSLQLVSSSQPCTSIPKKRAEPTPTLSLHKR